jgi:hypothetical protein
MEPESETNALLREIRDQQRLQIERQAEAMALQREQIAMVRQQFDRTERIQTRAEVLQAKGGKAMRVIVWVALPLVLLLALLVLWGVASSVFHKW